MVIVIAICQCSVTSVWKQGNIGNHHVLEYIELGELNMIIPNKIRIGGQDISVVINERLDDNKLGTICVAEGVLRIADNFSNSKQCESSKINTFIHEVVHGVLDTMGESELSSNEKFVSTFSSLLIDTIEDIVKANKNI